MSKRPKPPAAASPASGKASQRATASDACEQDVEDQLPAALLDAAPDLEREQLLGDLAHKHTAQRHAEIHGLFEILASKRRLFWINFLAGLSRGIGFFLGVTLVGGMLIGALALAFDFVASTLGLKELRFSSMVASLAEKYFEAEKVWTSVDSNPGAAAPHEPSLDDAAAGDAATHDGPAAHDGTPTTSDDALQEDG